MSEMFSAIFNSIFDVVFVGSGFSTVTVVKSKYEAKNQRGNGNEGGCVKFNFSIWVNLKWFTGSSITLISNLMKK